MSKTEEKTAAQKLREHFWNIKKNLKPSKELIEITRKKESSDTVKEVPEKKIARPSSPEAGA